MWLSNMNLSWFKNKSVKRVLLVHPYGIGDALFITPLIRTLKENGVNQIDLLLGNRTREVFEANPNIHQIFEWRKLRPTNFKDKIKYLFSLAQLYFQVWKNHYPIMFDCSPTAKFAFPSLAYFWIPLRIGFNFKGKGFFLTHKINLPRGFSGRSMVEYYLDLVRFLDYKPSDRKTEFFLKEGDDHSAEILFQKLNINLEQPIVAVAPGGGESWGKDARLKRWPVQNFALLIQKIFGHRGIFGTILVLGSKNERPLGDELIKHFDGTAIFNLCGDVSICASASLLRRSLCWIGKARYLVHLENALEVPLVAIFGPVDPQVYGPYPNDEKAIAIVNEGPVCRPCYQRFRYQEMCIGLECLNQLTPEKVYQQIKASRFLDAVKSAVLK